MPVAEQLFTVLQFMHAQQPQAAYELIQSYSDND